MLFDLRDERQVGFWTWAYLRSYVDFCRVIAKETLTRHSWFSSLKTGYKILALIVSVALLWWSLKEIVERFPPIGKRSWAIVILSVVVCGLLVLIGFIKAFHERTTKEIYRANEAIKKEYADSVAIIETWTLFKGRFDAISDLLDFRRWPDNAGAPLSKEEIQRYESDFHNKLQDRRGSEWVDDYFDKLGEIKNDLFAQEHRMKAHRNQSDRIIQEEQTHQQSITAKANQQKQEVLTIYRKNK